MRLDSLMRSEGKEVSAERVIDFLASESGLSDTVANVVEILLIWTQAVRNSRF